MSLKKYLILTKAACAFDANDTKNKEKTQILLQTVC